MLVPNQLIEVKISIKTIKHFKDLGYKVKLYDIIHVPPEHLTNGSHAIVDVVCDICGKSISKPYKEFLRNHGDNMDTCIQCKYVKAKYTNQQKYGVDNPFQNEEVKQKHRQTCLSRYGYEYISQIPNIKETTKQTLLDRYGVDNPAKSEIVKDKMIQTNLEKYGVSYTLQSKDIHNKAKQTCIKLYGYECPMQNPQIKAKAVQTLCQNGDIKTSSQQKSIYEIIKQKYTYAEMNYPFSTCSLDIFVPINDINIDIEYDGSYWHQDQQKDIKRDKYLQSQGFKVLRIRSGHLLPTEEELFNAIDYLTNTEHHFKEIILPDWKEGE